ncbi:MAG: protein kinase [Planctomycetes bacterium]|nr:protein kinase [Planctomycetota bacterium]
MSHADTTLVRLVAIALEQRASGQEVRLDEICGERRDLLPALSDAVGIAACLPELEIEAAPMPAQRVLGGRYVCEARLGAGSMGVVYRALDLELSRAVAVKILRSDRLTGPDAERRFATESQLLASVRHSAVVTIHDRGRTEAGESFFVMELLEGAPLHVIVEEAANVVASGGYASLDGMRWATGLLRLPRFDPSYLRTVVGWVADLASGLQAAHDADVLHRDIKPSNAFVRRNGAPVLLDFGLAARLADVGSGSGTGTFGTAAYVAPEQVVNPVPSVRADIYGLAATLYHLVTLRMPYSGTPAQILAQLQRRDPTPARRIRRDLPLDLVAILECGMNRDPARRYPTAEAFANDLRAFLAHRPVVARPTTWASRVWRHAQRSPAVRGGAVVAGLATLVLVGLELRRQDIASRRVAWLDTWSHLPPALTLWADPVLAEGRRQVAAGLLDAAAASCVEAVPTKLVRAAFRRDHGDVGGAIEDMRAVADEVGSPLAVELLHRHVETPAGSVVATEGLPAPTDDVDRYLLVFHLMRAGKTKVVREMLEAVATTFAPLCELQLALRLPSVRKQATQAERLGVARAIHEEAVRLETRIGRRTATTGYLIASALVAEGRYFEAKPIFLEGIELATPAYHALFANLAVAQRRTGDHDGAIDNCRRAISLYPSSAPAHETLIVTLVDRGDLEGAREALAESGLDPGARTGSEARVSYLEVREAWRNGDEAGARALARRTLALLQRVPDRPESPHEAAFCKAVIDGEDVFTAMVRAASEDVDDPWVLQTLVLPQMPSALDQKQTAVVRQLLEEWCRRRLEALR